MDKVHSCILFLEGKVVAASHDGYCSGDECEDIEVSEQHYIKLECSSDKVIDQLKYLESIDALGELFNNEIQFSYILMGLDENNYHTPTYGWYSYYCKNSPSGRNHEADFTATKVISVLDTIPVGINIYNDSHKPVINEKGLEKVVSLLKVK